MCCGRSAEDAALACLFSHMLHVMCSQGLRASMAGGFGGFLVTDIGTLSMQSIVGRGNVVLGIGMTKADAAVMHE